MPLPAYQDLAAFKLYHNDVGLLCAMAKLPLTAVVDGNAIFEEFKSSLTENYVLQHLLLKEDNDIFYWANENSSNEVYLVIQNLEEGAKVVIWDLNEERGKSLAAELGAVFSKVSTSDYTEIAIAAKEVNDKFGRIDILVNNAGITRDSTLKKMSIEQWQQVIDVNLSGVFYCTKVVSE